MLGCSTICPKCKHEFACCPPATSATGTTSPSALTCCSSTTTTRRSLHVLSGGGLITTTTTTTTTTALAPPLPQLSSPCPSPQVSPSVPLAFIMPPCGPLLPSFPPPENKPENELKRLADTVRALRLSGWYYEGLTFDQGHELLKDSSVGTFLVRNSSNPRFLFSLSVQTESGPKSVRLYYIDGYFRLDAQHHLESAMPMFPSVIDLLQHYVQQSKLCRSNALVWVDNQGKWYSSIVLDKPLVRRTRISSLKHLSRLAVHKALMAGPRPSGALMPAPHTQLDLPASLAAYLAEYPHSI